MKDEFLDQVIHGAFISQVVFSKARFDNAKDTQQLHAAANESADMLVAAVKAKVLHHREQLLVEHLSEALSHSDDNQVIVKVGGKVFEVREINE